MNALTAAQVIQARANFVNFATRDAVLSVSQANEELTYLFANPVRIRLLDSYLTVRRVGANFTLNRAQRKNIYDIFENAVNHATF